MINLTLPEGGEWTPAGWVFRTLLIFINTSRPARCNSFFLNCNLAADYDSGLRDSSRYNKHPRSGRRAVRGPLRSLFILAIHGRSLIIVLVARSERKSVGATGTHRNLIKFSLNRFRGKLRNGRVILFPRTVSLRAISARLNGARSRISRWK